MKLNIDLEIELLEGKLDEDELESVFKSRNKNIKNKYSSGDILEVHFE